MRRSRFLFLITCILAINNVFGQSGNLIPVDSSNYIIVGDSLIDEYKAISDSNLKFNFDPKKMEYCSCTIDSTSGNVSFKSSSFIIDNNTCFLIFLTDKGYSIRVGRMTKLKNKFGENIWRYKTVSLNESDAKGIIQEIKKAISYTQIPRYSRRGDIPIVSDGTTYVFGDLEKQKYGVAPSLVYSELVNLIINKSNKLVNKNIR